MSDRGMKEESGIYEWSENERRIGRIRMIEEWKEIRADMNDRGTKGESGVYESV